MLNRTEMDDLIQEKVQRFEEFVDRRLKPDLVHAIAERYVFIPMLLLNYTLQLTTSGCFQRDFCS